MDLQAKPYRCFVAVADLGSFTRAAAALHLSQPALSAQIRELERHLGFPLLERTSRRVALTRQGAAFIANARRIILETEWINQKAREIGANQLRVGAARYTNLIAERLRLTDAFMQAHPDMPIEISAHSHAGLSQALARNDIDLAVTVDVEPEPGAAIAEGDTRDGVERCVVARRAVKVLLPADHPLARRKRVPREALKGLTIASVGRTHGVALSVAIARQLNDLGAKRVRPPEADALGVRRYAALFGCAAIDLGWHETPAPPNGRALVARDVEGLNIVTALSVLRRRTAQRDPALAFWAHAQAIADENAAAPGAISAQVDTG